MNESTLSGVIVAAIWLVVFAGLWLLISRRWSRGLIQAFGRAPSQAAFVKANLGFGPYPLYVALILVGVVGMTLREVYSSWWLRILEFPLFAWFVVDVAFLSRSRRARFRAAVACMEYRVCTECLYPLHGLPDCGRCPECGRTYDVDELKAAWLRAFEARKAAR